MTRNPKQLVEGRSLSIGYPKQKATPLFEELNLSLMTGSLTCLMGPNGVGKSTLIKTLTGLIPAISGQVVYDGDSDLLKYPRKRAKAFAVVLTGNATFGMLRVREVVAIGRHPHTKWTGNYSHKDFEKVEWALGAVRASELAERWIHTLSDGERQRVMIARALAQETPTIYLDEPTAYLDLPHKIELMQILRGLARDCGLTLLISTHELEMALQHADQLWLMGKNGTFETGLPEDLLLSGQLERVFQGKNMSFDRQRGAFYAATNVQRLVSLSGDELAVKWTQNALEKMGIGIAGNEDAVLKIEVVNQSAEDSNCRWKVTEMNGVSEDEGIGIQSLIACLRANFQWNQKRP